jgi:hypothetical protein
MYCTFGCAGHPAAINCLETTLNKKWGTRLWTIVRAESYFCVRVFSSLLEVLCCGWTQITSYSSWVSTIPRTAVPASLYLLRESTHIWIGLCPPLLVSRILRSFCFNHLWQSYRTLPLTSLPICVGEVLTFSYATATGVLAGYNSYIHYS